MRLRDWRKRQKGADGKTLTQAELAARWGVAQTFISGLETGEKRPSSSTLADILRWTDGAVQPNDFFDIPAGGASGVDAAGEDPDGAARAASPEGRAGAGGSPLPAPAAD